MLLYYCFIINSNQEMKMQDTEKLIQTFTLGQEKEVADQFLANLRELIGNRFVGLRYYSNSADAIKKYNISLGVKKHIKGTGRKDEPQFAFVAYDHNAKHYRTFNLANFKYLNFRGKFYSFEDIYNLSA